MDELSQLGLRYAGLYQEERKKWKNEGDARYAPSRWAGIDCSGLVEVAANMGVAHALSPPSPDISSEPVPVDLTPWVSPAFAQLASDGRPNLERVAGSVQGIAKATYPLEQLEDDGTLGSYDSLYRSRRTAYWAVVSSSDEDAIGGEWAPEKVRAGKWKAVQRGDVLLMAGHVATAYSDVLAVSVKPSANESDDKVTVVDVWSMEASGDNLYRDKRPGKDPGAYVRCWRALRHLRPAIVHTRNLGTVDLQWVAALAGVRHRVHGEHGWDASDPQGRNPRHLGIRRACRPVVQRYVPMSQDLERWLVASVHVVPSRFRQIYSGVDTERFAPSPTPVGEGRGQGSSLTIGTVGRLDPVKNHSALLLAFAALAAGLPALRLTIVGDGPLRTGLESFWVLEGIQQVE